MLSVAILALAVIFVIKNILNANKEHLALKADWRTSEELTEWRNANPDLHYGDVAYARELIHRREGLLYMNISSNVALISQEMMSTFSSCCRYWTIGGLLRQERAKGQ